ncbi:hypothetical protein BDZ89DRAFT_148479, partial [Hymenopellis radicata]
MQPTRMQSDEHNVSFPQPSLTPPDSANTRTSWTARSSSSTLYTRTSKPLLGLGPSTSAHITNDPFDYEQKYAPDEEYEEMSPKARVYRVYVDESAKFDREMVNGWREALDVLLVFAALFSAVVTTFVTQTCQSLQVDQGQIGNSLLSEMIGVQRAMLHVMVYGPEAVKAVQPAVTSFPSKASDFWVNGLWFTSLGLSLTTTLLAVLAKQWIHQYTLIQAGSPRDHSRIRHFRYMALQKWHVPLIIELFPVLIHAALGLFFLGLIIYLCSLSAAMAAVMSFIAVAAFSIYSVCNILPVFYPDCAYKTPLALHSYSLFCFIRQRVATFLKRRGGGVLFPPHPSLSDMELDQVIRQGHILDASTLGWLFNVTSNLSVQSIVLQALSSLPLQNIPIIA